MALWFLNKDEKFVLKNALSYKRACEEEYLRRVHKLLCAYPKGNFNENDSTVVKSRIVDLEEDIVALREKYNIPRGCSIL